MIATPWIRAIRRKMARNPMAIEADYQPLFIKNRQKYAKRIFQRFFPPAKGKKTWDHERLSVLLHAIHELRQIARMAPSGECGEIYPRIYGLKDHLLDFVEEKLPEELQ
ncbi:MAG: hypothetical protein ACPHID_06900 [Thermoplasmatota archaeon]